MLTFRTQWDTASLPGSAGLVLGIISSVEDAMRLPPSPLIPLQVLGECFPARLLAGMHSKYPRCSEKLGLDVDLPGMLGGGSGLFGCGGYRMWSGKQNHAADEVSLAEISGTFFFPLKIFGLKRLLKKELCVSGRCP